MLPDYRVRQRDFLLEISRALTSRLDLSEVLRLILQLSAEIMDGQAALLALVDSDGRYRIRDAIGISQPMIEQLRPVLAEISDAREAETALLNNLVTLAQQAGIGRWTIIWLPLKNGDDSLGALYVFRGRGGEFSANDRRVLQSFADQAAIAVNNAQLYQQINTERKRLAAILEFSADGVVIMDNTRKIRTFNRVLIQLLGIAADDAIGKRFEDVLKVVNIRAGKTLEQAEAQGWPLATSNTIFVEGDLLRPDGRMVPVDISFAPLFDNTGQLVNIIADVHDLTRYRAADEMKSTFVSAVSHELRTPVALIKGYASTLRRSDASWDEKTLRDGLAVIEEESDRLSGLIDDLLDVSRAQAGTFKIHRSEVYIDHLVTRVTQKFQQQTSSHTLTLDIEPNLPLVYADEARIIQVLNNLISNAIKYSPAGSEVRVASEVNHDAVIIHVRDHGPGISKEDQARLFQRFFRTESAVKKSIPGTGLGLYLCRSIVEAHGGRIWVQSDGEHGSTFSFSLPRAPGQLGADSHTQIDPPPETPPSP